MLIVVGELLPVVRMQQSIGLCHYYKAAIALKPLVDNPLFAIVWRSFEVKDSFLVKDNPASCETGSLRKFLVYSIVALLPG